MTIERTTTIRNRLGLHARPAADFVKVAAKFQSEISLGKDGVWVNGKSIMGVMTLAAEFGSTVTVRAEGEDAKNAIEALAHCLSREYVEQ
ncbi:MAG: HPr family phosphocarrier protein [Gemmatimonadota bacterium]|nr:HPr family phosphocarrier protein [Gemmatimonadota bacterium]MDH3367267.1 HPr family phosphocarrier protein [Gemmatimonadota bacterium]MDH3479004.1 HPr family phosphocarrier protein [Gemmatimonadota bacterium]MDH3571245.1 HPr family phosphocarrier protein [Gemmatimonadota bacterium]MDH5549840.1 HPr family phosphocarrier protein [Gemmatimonadota bacterium]